METSEGDVENRSLGKEVPVDILQKVCQEPGTVEDATMGGAASRENNCSVENNKADYHTEGKKKNLFCRINFGMQFLHYGI
jgi:hypothetical protein